MSALDALRQRVGAEAPEAEVIAEIEAEIVSTEPVRPAFRRGAQTQAVEARWARIGDEWYVKIKAGYASVGEVVEITKREGTSKGRLTERGFSRDGYDYFKAAKVQGQTQGRSRRPNRYAGPCRLCGAVVPAEEGFLGERTETGSYTVEHAEGACVDPDAEPVTHDVADYTEPIWPGVYTIDYAEGAHRTLRVVVQGSAADFAPGATIVEYLAGRDNDSDYKGFAFVKGGRLQPWKRFRDGHHDLVASAQILLDNADALAEAAITGEPVDIEGGSILVSKHCIRCGRTLTNPDSNRIGIGPECLKKGW